MANFRYPKLRYYDGAVTRYVKVNRLSNYMLRELISHPYVMQEGYGTLRQKIPGHVVGSMEKVARKRGLIV